MVYQRHFRLFQAPMFSSKFQKFSEKGRSQKAKHKTVVAEVLSATIHENECCTALSECSLYVLHHRASAAVINNKVICHCPYVHWHVGVVIEKTQIENQSGSK